MGWWMQMQMQMQLGHMESCHRFNATNCQWPPFPHNIGSAKATAGGQ
jgi:hypothetical protein